MQGQRVGSRNDCRVAWGPPPADSLQPARQQGCKPNGSNVKCMLRILPKLPDFPVPEISPSHRPSRCRDFHDTLVAGHSSVAATRTSACEVSISENPTFKNRNLQNRRAGEVDDYLYLLKIGQTQFITELFLHAIFSQSSEQPSNLIMPISIYFYSISSLPPGVRHELFQTLSFMTFPRAWH